MTTVHFRNPEVRLSAALEATRAAVSGHVVTLRELLGLVGEQGLLVFCCVLATPFLLPVSLPFMSTALGVPMLLIGWAVVMNRVPWLPDRVLDHSLPTDTVLHVLERAARVAARFEHLVRPRMLSMTEGARINRVNGAMLVLSGVLLMAPLPLVPLANTLPAVGVILLCLGMAERDGVVVLLGYVLTLVSTVYVVGVFWLAAKTGRNIDGAWQLLTETLTRWF